MQAEAAVAAGPQKAGLHVREVLGDFLSWLALDHDALLPRMHCEHALAARLYATERALLTRDKEHLFLPPASPLIPRENLSELSKGDTAPGIIPYSRESSSTNPSLSSALHKSVNPLNDTPRNPRDLLFQGSYENFIAAKKARDVPAEEKTPVCEDLSTSRPQQLQPPAPPEIPAKSEEKSVVRISPFDVRSLLGKRAVEKDTSTETNNNNNDEREKEGEARRRRRSPPLSSVEDHRAGPLDLVLPPPPRFFRPPDYYGPGLYDKLKTGLHPPPPHPVLLLPPPSSSSSSAMIPHHPLIPSPPHDLGRREDFPACACPRCVPRGEPRLSPDTSPHSSSASSSSGGGGGGGVASPETSR